ncbi:MAG: hypothetical protein V1760_03720 [Candidatus Peregrinibacteria bacterium]
MNLKDSIRKTIAFFDLFDYPLTAEEVKRHLYQYDKPVHLKEIQGTLRQMAEAGDLEALKDFYVLRGRAAIIETRKSRKFMAEKLWNRVKLHAKTMQRVPFVRLVAVCNTLSYDNTDETSDIDLFVVTEPGHLWTGRFILTALLHFFGVRRHGHKVAGRFCLSFFATSEKLNVGALQIKPVDPYLAYWTQNLTPIYGEAVYREFQRENQGWLKEKYGLSFLESSQRHLYPLRESKLKRFCEWLLGNWFEHLLKKTFKKKTLASAGKLGPEASVIVSDDMLKFHNHDRRREFYERWLRTTSTPLPPFRSTG